jgi:hypothetical protein
MDMVVVVVVAVSLLNIHGNKRLQANLDFVVTVVTALHYPLANDTPVNSEVREDERRTSLWCLPFFLPDFITSLPLPECFFPRRRRGRGIVGMLTRGCLEAAPTR